MKPDRKEAVISGFSSIPDGDDPDIHTAIPFTQNEKKMKKDLPVALETFVMEGSEQHMRKLEKGDLTREERIELVRKSRGFHTSPGFGNPSRELMERTYAAFNMGLSQADPSTGITDLPSHFRNKEQALWNVSKPRR